MRRGLIAVASVLLAFACSSSDGGTIDDSGKTCRHSAECANGRCVSANGGPVADDNPGVCTRTCTTTDDCTKGWTCAGPSDDGIELCRCQRSAEVCDGLDNDCDGEVDDHCTPLPCGGACSPSQVCDNGTCVCAPSLADCDGRCVLLANDVSNCGACGRVCSGNTECVYGECKCASYLFFCNGSCRRLDDDANCGSCDLHCGTGTHCFKGKCVAAPCAAPTIRCNGSDACIDASKDPQNCGACGNVCPSGTTCSGSKCVCTTSCAQGECDPAGACHPLTTVSTTPDSIAGMAVGTTSIVAALLHTVTPQTRRVVSISKTDGSSTELANGPTTATPIVAGDRGDDFAYAFGAYGLEPVKIVGCPGGACATILSMTAMPVALGVSSGYAYWVTATKSIERCPLSGCGAPEKLGDLPPASTGKILMSVDGSGVYLTDASYLMRVVPGSALEALHWVSLPLGIALDDAQVFVFEQNGAIAVSKTGAFAPSTYFNVVPGLIGARAPVSDGQWVYWLGGGPIRAIWRCAAGATCTSPTPFRMGVDAFSFMDQDATALYLATSTKIVRVDK